MKILSFFIFGTLFIFTGCTKNMEWALSESGAINISAPGINFTNVENIPWKTGKKKDVQVSKGVRFELQLPNPDSDLAKLLYKDYASDSWVLVVGRVNSRGTSDILGSIMLPFPTKNSSFSSLMNASFYVNYAAIMPSRRFEKFDCPAFGHNLQIDTIDIQSSSHSKVEFTLLPKSPNGKRFRYQKKQEIGAPIQFNGGAILKGTYKFEIALYNSDKQTLVSNLIPLEQEVVIGKELEISIPGCSDFEIPEDKMRGVNKADTFQFRKN